MRFADSPHPTSYIAEDNPKTARRFVAEIFRQTDLLAEHPEMGRAGRIPGTRELVITGYPYIIPYRIRRNVVEILRIFHTARRWPESM